MEDEKKHIPAKQPVLDDDDPELEERIRNTADLLARFARENLDKESADEIIGNLDDIIDK